MGLFEEQRRARYEALYGSAERKSVQDILHVMAEEEADKEPRPLEPEPDYDNSHVVWRLM